MPNTYVCKGVSNPNVPIFPLRVCTLVLFIFIYEKVCMDLMGQFANFDKISTHKQL